MQILQNDESLRIMRLITTPMFCSITTQPQFYGIYRKVDTSNRYQQTGNS